jgi:hypothetical protein
MAPSVSPVLPCVPRRCHPGLPCVEGACMRMANLFRSTGCSSASLDLEEDGCAMSCCPSLL